MKKILCFIIIFLVALGLCGCVKGRNELVNDISSVEESVEKTVSKTNELSKDTSSAKSSTEQNVSEAPETVGTDNVLQVFPLQEENRLYLSKSGYRYALNLLIDNHIEKIYEDSYISSINPSPDRKKVIFNNFDWEVTAKVYLYDVESKQKKELVMNLPEIRTASFMGWLDDRYFLFVVQFDQGTVVRGGDLYVYDTDTDQCRKIIGTEMERIEICSFESYNDDFILLQCVLHDEALTRTDNQYYVVTVEEIRNLIDNGKTMVLKQKNAFYKT
jgi:hypothetical protein